MRGGVGRGGRGGGGLLNSTIILQIENIPREGLFLWAGSAFQRVGKLNICILFRVAK